MKDEDIILLSMRSTIIITAPWPRNLIMAGFNLYLPLSIFFPSLTPLSSHPHSVRRLEGRNNVHSTR